MVMVCQSNIIFPSVRPASIHPSVQNTISSYQGSGNFEIWIGPADDDDVINEPISKKKNMCISPVTKTNDNWQSYNSF